MTLDRPPVRRGRKPLRQRVTIIADGFAPNERGRVVHALGYDVTDFAEKLVSFGASHQNTLVSAELFDHGQARFVIEMPANRRDWAHWLAEWMSGKGHDLNLYSYHAGTERV